MSVFTYSSQEEVESSGCLNGRLVGCALRFEVLGISIEDMDILLRLINLAEEIGVHERVVTLRMTLRKAYILIHIERDDILERKFSGLHHPCQFGIGLDRS